MNYAKSSPMARTDSVNDEKPPPYTAPALKEVSHRPICSFCFELCTGSIVWFTSLHVICAHHRDEFHEQFRTWVQDYPELVTNVLRRAAASPNGNVLEYQLSEYNSFLKLIGA